MKRFKMICSKIIFRLVISIGIVYALLCCTAVSRESNIISNDNIELAVFKTAVSDSTLYDYLSTCGNELELKDKNDFFRYVGIDTLCVNEIKFVATEGNKDVDLVEMYATKVKEGHFFLHFDVHNQYGDCHYFDVDVAVINNHIIVAHIMKYEI